MALMEWSDTLSAKVEFVDTEHKKLVGMVNELHEAMSKGKSKDVMGKILQGLVDYTQSHFKHEETEMTRTAYPGFQAHKAEHMKLLQQVGDFKTKFEKGQAMMSVDLMNFLKEWLVHHIQQVDKQMGLYLNSKGVK